MRLSTVTRFATYETANISRKRGNDVRPSPRNEKVQRRFRVKLINTATAYPRTFAVASPTSRNCFALQMDVRPIAVLAIPTSRNFNMELISMCCGMMVWT
jgi:hypothetical protein